MIFDYAQLNPDKLAVTDGERSYSFAELCQRSMARLEQLRERGLQAGDHIALLTRNRADAVEWVMAGLVHGLWVVPVNWHLAPPEINYILRDAKVSLLVAELELVAEEFADLPLVSLDESPVSKVPANPDLQGAAGGMMIYTGGTTGKPKGVKRAGPATIGELFHSQAEAGRALGLEGGRHLITGPVYHAAPFLFAFYHLHNGATLHIMPRFDEETALQLIEQYQITHTHWVPTMLVRALKLPPQTRKRYDLSSLKLVLHGAGPISIEVKQQIIDWWGPILTEYWGGTESGVCTLCDTQEWQRYPGTVGNALSRFEVFTVGEHGERLLPGREGQLYARHKVLGEPFTYYNDPQKTANAYLEPGVFTLGDYGVVNEQGYVFIRSRRSNLIVSGGVNIYPAEVEAALLSHPEITDAVVFGLEDEEWGATVNALVEVPYGEPIDADELRDFLVARIAKFKLPRQCCFVEDLGRNPAGKVSLPDAKSRFLGLLRA